MLQGTVGLIGTYLSPTGAYTLRSTGRLGGVQGPGRRLSQSTRLFQGMGDEGAMRDGTLKATVTKVRLVHASVRQLHKKSGEWDYAKSVQRGHGGRGHPALVDDAPAPAGSMAP